MISNLLIENLTFVNVSLPLPCLTLVPDSRMTKASLDEEAAGRGGGGSGYPSANECEERSSVELAVAPHLPLLHHALLHDPASETPANHVSYTPTAATVRS